MRGKSNRRTSEKIQKLIHGEAGLLDDASERAGGQIAAVDRDDDAGPWSRWMAQDVVTAFDMVHAETPSFESSNHSAAPQRR